MKRLMILGASYTQVPLYKAAHRLGLHTAAASIDGEYPGFDLADEKYYVDISDPEAVVEAARKYGADGVATCGLDLGVRAIGAVCDALGLHGMTRLAAERAGNKYEMKKALSAAGVQTARFCLVHNEEELEEALRELSLPVVTKAVDQMGSRGIFRCDTKEEAHENLKKSMAATKKDYCLVEEFIEGRLFGVEALVQSGRPVFILPNNTEAFQGAVPSPVGHSIPFRDLTLLGEQISEQTIKAINALGLDNCPVNCDFIQRGDKVYIVELTGRSGATGLSEMVSLYYGVDYYEIIARLAVGEDVSKYFEHPRQYGSVLTHTLTSGREGILRNIAYKAEREEWLKDISFNVRCGDKIKPYTNGRDRIGQVILTGDSLEQCEGRLSYVLRDIKIELEKDIALFNTPIHSMRSIEGENNIYIKREDLLPLSFGGNKVRFAQGYLEDMESKRCDAMIIYGGYHSNLCRILAAACSVRNIPCSMVSNIDDAPSRVGSFNKRLIEASTVKEYTCRKASISSAVQKAMDDFALQGRRPYYIHGNIYGEGNIYVPMKAYADVYFDIIAQEKQLGIRFDYIFLASSTNATQSGLLAGMLQTEDARKIIGISVTRNQKRAAEVIQKNLNEYREVSGVEYRLEPDSHIFVEDGYLFGGYGQFGDEITEVIRTVYKRDGIPLDPIYTAKAFYGMKEYLRERGIKNKNILFIHTGGAPLFFDVAQDIDI